MTALWLSIIILLAAASALFLGAGWRQRQSSEADRDRLNTDFYHQRLRELEEDEAQGVIGERATMVSELQQTLLTDIPQQGAAPSRASSRLALLPGVVVLIAVSLGMYLKSGGLAQVAGWMQVQQDYPALRARVMDPQAKPLTMEELARLQLGLRTALQSQPDNLNDWTMLGRLGMVLNNAASASQAFEHALQLAPNNLTLKQDYAEVLTRSSDPQDNRQAGLMLRDMLKDDGNNLRTLGLLAFNAYEQQQYDQAISAWQAMLKQIPAEDQRRAMIERSIEQAKTDAGQQNTQLALTVTLTPEAEKMLPPGGVMYISVSDGVSPVPVAVKRLPLSHFPLSLTLDDSNAMMPERLLSAQHQVQVRVRISRDGSASPQSGDWFGLSALTPWDGHQHMAVEINQQQP
ncbi:MULTISPECIES: c-type cytochrome biogenesis protein CcmI [Pantoea]|jgi:cytochrome c-type biogenesis protein CcmI|uniref:C-type cytochrome biogenesis protein CcmI n=2 Tax=Pantoea piersonii TaxID=2364647 RepID=A0AAJ5UAU1_9GAMM|nr:MULTISPECIES: c-type cytochrome biogenesis protein CcmI [Pantoea]HCW99516.1 c-type cytochrome biogenesis protein CcmI [Pantoea sp.]MBZ6387413.1 c-type cytochrome biogenesis protein CcmI [Pantoea piersonii]MBZ6400724.1 c-type cytochrome biogenesis protein CcmI [Pantoea piersonii]MBZ6408664.1 c-type cytochrome biogenesis protein CcmI [Pantoea piersonii]MBZ6429217.1 c-type cytochrome biogenesis protein CcmI [Pantoea piersonii]